MAGLLGDSWDDPRTMAALQMAGGLLASGGPSLQPQNLGHGLLGGLQQYQGVMDNARRQKAADEELRIRKLLADAQIANYTSEADARKALAAEKVLEAQRKRSQDAFMLGLVNPTTPQRAASLPGGPMNANAEAIGQSPTINADHYRQAVALGIPVERVRAFAEANDFGRSKVARTVETLDAQGRPITVQLDEFGRPVGAGMGVWKAPVEVKRGDRTSFVDPVSMATRGEFTINTSPDALYQGGITMRGQNLSAQTAREGHDIQRAGQTAPKFQDGAWMYPPTAQNPEGGMIRTPAYAPPKNSPEALAQSSKKTLSVIDEADKLLAEGATGSYTGAGFDTALAAFGASTKGAQNSAKLKALEGAIVMAQPRMEGPQSDKDTQLYRQMAGQIGDSTIPVPTRRAALQTIRALHEKYAGSAPGVAPGGPATMRFNPSTGKLERIE